ncbi:MAG: hypothetical protein JSW27_16460 [Phycisphaerales bacterium]|nr:MAG: hypothetical protein JSW27_16460 [Phycisphaerales bacterium]
MKANRETDELLCSFIDGELPLRQQTEVQRLAARDPEVAERLRELQNCRNLVSALPRAEAPGLMLEQIKQSLERQTLLEERPVLTGTRAGTRHLRVRRFVAAAAMIALLGGLGAVIYQIVAPVSPTAAPGPLARTGGRPGSFTMAPAATAGFSGRLELRTAAFAQADAFIKRAIEYNGLAGLSHAQSLDGGRVYRIESSREGLNRLVADLGGIWQNFDSAALTVNSDQFAQAVVVAPVTLQQTAKIVNQDSTQASVAVAQDIAVLNSFAEAMPGRDILSRPGDKLGTMVPAIPRPVLTSDDPDTKQIATVPEGTVKVSLTIVLLNTQ